MADPWWRFYCETISDRKFKYLSKVCGLSKLELIGAWAIICTIGHESPRYGALQVTSQLRVTVTDLVDELEISQEKVEKMIAGMIDKGMLLREEDGTLFVVNLEKRQYKDIKAAQRMQKYRQSLPVTSPVTSPVTHTETETETDIKGGELSQKFTEITTIMPYNLEDWCKAEQTMKSAGVQVDEIQVIIDKLKGENMTITGLWSIVKTGISVHADHKNHRPVSGGKRRNSALLDAV